MADNAPIESNRLLIEVSAGELIDKITILEIKRSRLRDPASLANVERELRALTGVSESQLRPTTKIRAEFDAAVVTLRQVNEALWDIEDEIRGCEARKDFGERFVELARGVYQQNDRRSRIKRDLNELLGSRLVEEKQYVSYSAT